MKKYEMYINKIKTGILNINWDVTKKAIAYSVAGIISATTLTGCSFKTNEKNINVVTENKISYDDIDDELQAKLEFVDDVLNQIEGKDKNPFYNEIMTPYKKYKRIEYEIDNSNEYAIFYTEEEILDMKTEMKKHINNAIEIIENKSSLKFDDYINNIKQK